MGRVGTAYWKLMHGSATRGIARARRTVTRAGELAERTRALSDAELTAAAAAQPAEQELFALAREAADRALGLRPFDVQLMGAARMLAGDVVEMATGEGKTLSGAIAAAAFALRGRAVQVISVNDYLARRDAEWMAPFYALLGVGVGWVGADSTWEHRRDAYRAQVSYGSVSEVGFDLLRDRQRTDVADLLEPDADVALIDEADSVLVDEALVPLVLAGAADAVAPSQQINDTVRELRKNVHYELDTEGRNVTLTAAGARAVERALGGVELYSADGDGHLLSLVNTALHAHALLTRDVHYVVRDGRVKLINSSRGRIAQLQRWPDGLHAAVEAKEGLETSQSGEILDSMTVQALVGRYRTVCGMTGTALAAEEQLEQFYKLSVSPIPPNEPCVRTDHEDRIFGTAADKDAAIVEHVVATHGTGQPILIGTLDVAESEELAAALDKAGVSAAVLNAKNDAAEAAIIAEAGAYGAVTVSTQMAGRGTDIRLGGAEASDYDTVVEAGGLCVIGTGRHAASRLDNQLRGRAGRQGDPGRSVFFVSLEDELVAKYAAEMAVPGEDGELPTAKVGRIVEHAQRVAEGEMLEIHTNTWRYNQLIEQQRELIGTQRDQLLRTTKALDDLAASCPERVAELRATVPEDALAAAARTIALYHLDRCWADHLAYLSDVREGIHLHALSRRNPLDEFHRAAIPAFNETLQASYAERIVETFTAATITADGVDLDGAGLRRPSATWTYMVHDNPFGTGFERTLRGIAAKMRSMADR